MTAMTGFAPAALVQGIQRQPLPYGLFSVLTFRPGADRWMNGIKWEPGTCEPASTLGMPLCEPDENGRTQGEGYPKNLDPNIAQWATAEPFTVYGHYRCSAPSTTVEDAEAQALQHLLTREEAAVEREVWRALEGENSQVGNLSVNDLGTRSPALALSELEDFNAATYGSLGVIHMSRGAATYLSGKGFLVTSGGRLTTVLGTPVVAGAGYVGKGDGVFDMFVTPALVGYRSDVFAPSSERGDLIDRATNTLTAIAERQYVIGTDPCGAAKATFNLSEITPVL